MKKGAPFFRDALQVSACSCKRKSRCGLEDELRSQLQRARVARERLFGIAELRTAGLQEIPAPGVPDGLNIVQRSRHELRVIQHVECLCREFDFLPFGEREALQSSEVEVVDVTRWQSIPAEVQPSV